MRRSLEYAASELAWAQEYGVIWVVPSMTAIKRHLVTEAGLNKRGCETLCECPIRPKLCDTDQLMRLRACDTCTTVVHRQRIHAAIAVVDARRGDRRADPETLDVPVTSGGDVMAKFDIKKMFEERVHTVVTYLEAHNPVTDKVSAARKLGIAVGLSPPIAQAVIGHLVGMNMVEVVRATSPHGKDQVITKITLLPETEWLDEKPDWEGIICDFLREQGPVVDAGGYAVAKLKERSKIPFSTGHIRNLLRGLEDSDRIHRAIQGKRTYCVALKEQPLFWPPGKNPNEPVVEVTVEQPLPRRATASEVMDIEERRKRDRERKARVRAERRGEVLPPIPKPVKQRTINPLSGVPRVSLKGMTDEELRAHKNQLAKLRKARKPERELQAALAAASPEARAEVADAMGFIMGQIVDDVNETFGVNVPDADDNLDYNKLGRAMVEECGKILAGDSAGAEFQARLENAETEIVTLRQELTSTAEVEKLLRDELKSITRMADDRGKAVTALEKQLAEAKAQLTKRSTSADIGPEEKKSIQGFLRGLMRDDR